MKHSWQVKRTVPDGAVAWRSCPAKWGNLVVVILEEYVWIAESWECEVCGVIWLPQARCYICCLLGLCATKCHICCVVGLDETKCYISYVVGLHQTKCYVFCVVWPHKIDRLKTCSDRIHNLKKKIFNFIFWMHGTGLWIVCSFFLWSSTMQRWQELSKVGCGDGEAWSAQKSCILCQVLWIMMSVYYKGKACACQSHVNNWE